jgi:hypothetical protein
MNASNGIKTGGLAVLGRVVGSTLSGAAVLVVTWLILVGSGVFRVTLVQVVMTQADDPARRSFHIFGNVFEQGDFGFHIFCVLFLLPCVATALLVWIRLGRRWQA